jgi:hypothetical protein
MKIPTHVNKYFDKQVYEDDRRTMTPDLFKTDYMAEFAEVGSSYFSEEAVNKCSMSEYDIKSTVAERGWVYSLGIDPARLRDTSAMVVMGQNQQTKQFKVCHVHGFSPDISGRPSETPEQFAYIGLLYNGFNRYGGFEYICPENTGMGGPYTEELKRYWRETFGSSHLIQPYDTNSLQAKIELYSEGKKAIEQGDVTISRLADRLLHELKMTQFGATEQGKPKVVTPVTDDYADAFCLSLMPFKEPFKIGVGVVKRERQPLREIYKEFG